MINPSVQKQAIDWFVRLRSDAVSSGDRHEFGAWRRRSHAHVAAYKQVEQCWESLAIAQDYADDQLQRLLPEHPSDSTSNGTERRLFNTVSRWGLAVAAVLVLLAAPFFYLADRDTYRTAVGEQRRILLDDGSSIHLNTDSLVKVELGAERRMVHLERGEVLCDVAHDARRPFIVSAGETEVAALGTRFSVYRAPQQTRVTVVEGRVAVVPSRAIGAPADRQTVVKAGEQLRLAGSTASIEAANEMRPVAPTPIDPNSVISWDRGLLVFEQTPLDEVVDELQRYFPGDLRLGSDVPPLTVTGTFKLRDRAVLLSALSETLPVQAVRVDDATWLVYRTP